MRPKRDGSNHFEEKLVSRGDDLMHKKKKIHRPFPINTMGLHVTGGCSDSLAKKLLTDRPYDSHLGYIQLGFSLTKKHTESQPKFLWHQVGFRLVSGPTKNEPKAI